MFTFSSLDTYKISHYKKDVKFNMDHKVLVRLYQPIIGSVAMSLYLTLESEISLNKHIRTSQSISRLYKLLQISDEMFNDAIEVLKEYNLISYKANKRKADDYLFLVYPTLTAVEFFASEKLNNALQVCVDNNYYKQVYDYFISSAIIDDEYIDIEEVKLSKEITDVEFFEQFFDKYPMIASSISFGNKEKKEIIRLKKLFSLSYVEIENAMLNSMGYVGNHMSIDLNNLNEYIQNKFNKEKDKDSDEYIASNFDKINPIAYYKQLAKRETLLPRETAMIEELLSTYKISEGVLNTVINYYFTYGKNTVSNPKNYFIKVIEEMLINNVKTSLDAMNYFRNRNKRIQSYKENLKNEVKLPTSKKEDKLDESTKEIDKDTLDEFLKAFGD